MPAVHIKCSTEIDAPVGEIHEVLTDFNTWPMWSPWLYMEPDATVTYCGDKGKPGHGYQWSGQKVGAGNMSLLESSETELKCDLHFLKPFKSQANVAFTLERTTDKSTRVTWLMDSSLPFFMFWMAGTMRGMIHSDFRRGLALLKDYIELGTIRSSTRLHDIVETPEADFIGYRSQSDFDAIAASVSNSFDRVSQFTTTLTDAGTPFCIYHKVDMKNQILDFTAAVPIPSRPDSVEPPLLVDKRPACRALKAVHVGDYSHLSNAWAMLMGEARHRKAKTHRSQSPFEIYLNSPETTTSDELITELYLPLRR